MIAQILPSYWLVQASQLALGGRGWDSLGWAVMIAWTIILSVLAAHAFRRDTHRA